MSVATTSSGRIVLAFQGGDGGTAVRLHVDAARRLVAGLSAAIGEIQRRATAATEPPQISECPQRAERKQQMPHDSKGQLLQEGDLVTITCRVESVSPQEDFCNATLKPVIPDGVTGDSSMDLTITTNAKLLTKVQPPAAEATAAAESTAEADASPSQQQ